MINDKDRVFWGYLLMFLFVVLFFSMLRGPAFVGEWDDYSLTTISLITDGNAVIGEQDVEAHKQLIPDSKDFIDNYSLSGYFTKSGEELPWYFATYSAACIPMVFMLKTVHVSAAYAFSLTNIISLILCLLVVYFFLRVSEKKRLLAVVLLSANPILFYINWISAEVFIYAMLVVGITFWYNRWYKRAALFVSLAGTLNPTAMAIGIIIIVEFLLFRLKDDNQYFTKMLKKNLLEIIKLGGCFFVGIIPFIYNFYYTGYINLTASYDMFLQSEESVLQRAFSYLFDLNFGILPYFLVILLSAVILIPLAVVRYNWRYLCFVAAFVSTVLSYSFMIHINCGMTGISRYNAWGAVTLLFAVFCFYDEILLKKSIQNIQYFFLVIGAALTSFVVSSYVLTSNLSYTEMLPFAQIVLHYKPGLYNPLPSTFYSRTAHVDGGYSYITPVVYCDPKDGAVRKILAKPEDAEGILENYSVVVGKRDWLEEQLSKLNNQGYISVNPNTKVVKTKKLDNLQTLHFVSNEFNAEDYVIHGLSTPEEVGTWTDGHELLMRFRIPIENKTLSCSIDCGVFEANQKVDIDINGTPVFSERINSGPIRFTFDNGEYVEIRISLPNAASPKSLGISEDSRILGLLLRQIEFSTDSQDQ